jgi:hypothetical protein
MYLSLVLTQDLFDQRFWLYSLFGLGCGFGERCLGCFLDGSEAERGRFRDFSLLIVCLAFNKRILKIINNDFSLYEW